VRVLKADPSARARAQGDIFVGDVDALTAVGEEHSRDLRVTEVHFKSGARNRWHVHSTDQVLLVTDGDGVVEMEGERHDLVPGTVALIPAKTRHWHGAKPGKDMTHWSILGPAETKVVD
jgi:quercetin dioxygenase-like cupin family protein